MAYPPKATAFKLPDGRVLLSVVLTENEATLMGSMMNVYEICNVSFKGTQTRAFAEPIRNTLRRTGVDVDHHDLFPPHS